MKYLKIHEDKTREFLLAFGLVSMPREIFAFGLSLELVNGSWVKGIQIRVKFARWHYVLVVKGIRLFKNGEKWVTKKSFSLKHLWKPEGGAT
jgi:hypothetical protein